MSEAEADAVERLLARSSLGTEGARQLRNRADRALVQRAADLAASLADQGMSPDELGEISKQLRAKERQTDDELVERVVAEVERYRGFLSRHNTQLPPPPLDELLPLMGWLIYEASWDCVQRVDASFDRDAADPDTRRQSEAELARVDQLANSARQLPWPEFAPRALGALRALALAESKRDTEPGYDAAWTLHEEAQARYREYRDSQGDEGLRKKSILALDEVFLQLALAKIGTACRTAERVIVRWAEQFEDPEKPERTRAEEQRWIERMFRDLSAGVAVGERAIDIGERIKQDPGFADHIDEHRLTRHSALQNPGIMTARAASLLLVLRQAMEVELGRRPAGHDSWDQWEENILCRFVRAYRVIESEVLGPDGRPVKMDRGFQRQLVHIRLNLALLKPGYDLPSARAADLPCLALNPLDDAAVEAMSAWLAGPQGLGRENALAAATMPMFVRSLIACRGLGSDDNGYKSWRIKHFTYHRYFDEPERLDWITGVLAQAAA
ncbi:hypothetical protein [Jatrophihabitans sp.]|jgi:hypothetical protein|uniref:hypothetical protein n=1 Tax=Jatrophihabitans sp. TaxID=1932789 RepID=UPI002EF48ED0